MKKLWELFVTFVKIGSMTFGGGYALLPIIQREIVDNKKWATDEQIVEYYAIGQCTPGLISVNTATFVGNEVAGVAGGIIATLGFVLPSIIVITLVAGLLENFANYPIVKNAFAGIRVCVCVLILEAVVKMWKNSISDPFTIVIYIGVLAASVFLSASPVLLVIIAAAGGIAGGAFLAHRNSPYVNDFLENKDARFGDKYGHKIKKRKNREDGEE
ncbi:MAG: chromate transporter [Anaerovoracaceae bacterium]|jgi:chromate transporter